MWVIIVETLTEAFRNQGDLRVSHYTHERFDSQPICCRAISNGSPSFCSQWAGWVLSFCVGRPDGHPRGIRYWKSTWLPCSFRVAAFSAASGSNVALVLATTELKRAKEPQVQELTRRIGVRQYRVRSLGIRFRGSIRRLIITLKKRFSQGSERAKNCPFGETASELWRSGESIARLERFTSTSLS